MGYTRYYTLCKDKNYLVHVLSLILHYNTADYEDVGEPLKNVKYAVIPQALKDVAGRKKKYQKFKDAEFILTYDNEGGRNSTRPFFYDRRVDPDADEFIPDEPRRMINGYDVTNEDIDIPWTIVTPRIDIYKDDGEDKLNDCIRQHIEAAK